MNRRLLAAAAVLLLALTAWWAYRQAQPPPQPASSSGQEDLAEDSIITASATVSPEKYAILAFRSGGRVDSVNATTGKTVAAGDILIQLADADLKAGLAQAEATLASTKADLARLRAGARVEEVAQAKAVLAGAQAALDQLKAGARPGEIAQARAAVAAAQADLRQVSAGTRPEQVAVSKAQVQQAETTLARAQETYDRVRWAGGDTEREARYQRDAAGTALNVAKAQLALSEAAASANEIAAAQALVSQAQAHLEVVQAGATEQEIAAAQAKVAQAQASLDLLKAGATAEELAVAQARVEAAQGAADQAQALLAETSIKAPFAGTITNVSVRRGEVVAPGQPVITLADLSTLQLETDDLSETRVAEVKVGHKVSVSFEALPNATFQGKVKQIAPMATLKQGGTNYMVTIVLDKLDPALRWGMTGHIEIDPVQ